MSSVESPPAVMTVLVYSDDVTTRDRIKLAIGTQPVTDLPSIDYVECATHRPSSRRSTQVASTSWCLTARRCRAAAWASAVS